MNRIATNISLTVFVMLLIGLVDIPVTALSGSSPVGSVHAASLAVHRTVHPRRKKVDVDVDVDRRGPGRRDADVDVDVDRRGRHKSVDVDVDVDRRPGLGGVAAGVAIGTAVSSEKSGEEGE
jgi:hypothetical protein